MARGHRGSGVMGGDPFGCNETVNYFVAEFTRTLDKSSAGKVERVQVVTV